jgi:hypothetical protein
MRNRINAAQRARYWLSLLMVFLIVISPASCLSAAAATMIARASLSQSANASDMADAKRLN